MPDAPEAWVEYNQEVALGERERDRAIEERYGSVPGEIHLSPQDRRDIIEMQRRDILRQREARERQERSGSSRRSSSVVSPRGELSGVSGISGNMGSPLFADMPSLESSGGARRWSMDSSPSSIHCLLHCGLALLSFAPDRCQDCLLTLYII